MVRLEDYAAPAAPPKSKKRAAGKKKRKEAETGECSAPPVELGRSTVSLAPSPVEDSPARSASLPIVSASTGLAGVEEEEEEEERVEPPLKRKRLVRIGDLPSGPSGRGEKEKKKKSKGEGRAADAEQWEPAIKLAKTASIGDLKVSRHIAERITPPVDERIMDRTSNQELGSQLIRLGIRSAAMSFAVVQRFEALDQEVRDLHEQMKALKGELTEVKEGRDLLQAQNTSLEEEKKIREEAMSALKTQFDAGEEERIRAVAARGELIKACEVLEGKLELERKLKEKFLEDCHAAVEGKRKTEEVLTKLGCSVKEQRIEAIKRWKRRNLNAECLELACDVTLSVLRKCHEIHVPDGSERPSFEDYAEPLLPALGLSLGEMEERVSMARTVVPDEELDRSSEEEEEGEEEDEDAPPLSSPPDSTVDPSSADPVVGPSPPLADPSSPPEGSG